MAPRPASNQPTPEQRRVERKVVAASLVALLGAAGFAAVYVLGGQVQAEGAALFVALSAFAYALATIAKNLLPQGPYVEEREPMRSPDAERAVLYDRAGRDDAPLLRAGLARRVLIAAAGALGLATLFPVASLARNQRPGRALAHTKWKEGTAVVDEKGIPLKLDDIPLGSIRTGYPRDGLERADSTVVLIRVDPADFDLTEAQLAATVDGLIAFSKVCTHAGCPVSLYAQTTGQLMCPCHQSIFDVYQAARPLGGPAARPLPQLPLRASAEGFLYAGGDFPEPIGPGYWRRPS